MILLALDTSSSIESLAILEDGRIRGSRAWAGDRAHSKTLFTAIRETLIEQGLTADRIDAYALGLGPGSFAGLRMALACLQGMAAPGDKPVFGLASAEAAAWETAMETGASRVWVCGDGRRGRIWSACFERADDGMRRMEEWRLDEQKDAAASIPPGAVMRTADWPALSVPLLEAARAGGFTLVEKAACPSAAAVGALALLKMEKNRPSLPLAPLYLHPPVFVPPSFIEKETTPSQESV